MVLGDFVASSRSKTSKSFYKSTTLITLAISTSYVGFEEVVFSLAMS